MEKILTTVEVKDGEWIFTLSVWFEAPARYRKVKEDDTSRSDKTFRKNGGEKSGQIAEEKEANQRAGKVVVMEEPVDIDVKGGFYTRDINYSHLAATSNHKWDQGLLNFGPPTHLNKSGSFSKPKHLAQGKNKKPLSAEPFTDTINFDLNRTTEDRSSASFNHEIEMMKTDTHMQDEPDTLDYCEFCPGGNKLRN